MKITRETPTPEAVFYVADNIREIDKEEALAASDLESIHATLHDSVEGSWLTEVVRVDGEPVLVWGASPVGRGFWGIWLLGTDALDRHKKTLFKESRKFISALLEVTSARGLINMTLEKNELHQRWLSALGADFGNPGPWGKNGEMFIPFIIKRKVGATCVDHSSPPSLR